MSYYCATPLALILVSHWRDTEPTHSALSFMSGVPMCLNRQFLHFFSHLPLSASFPPFHCELLASVLGGHPTCPLTHSSTNQCASVGFPRAPPELAFTCLLLSCTGFRTVRPSDLRGISGRSSAAQLLPLQPLQS